MAPFVRGLFKRADLVPFLYNDRDDPDIPHGHTARSRGFKLKMTDNPVMNADHRSIGLVGTTDGVPYFDDRKRGAWPFILRVGNLPDGLSTHISNCHLNMLAASEFWSLDTDANVLRRRVKAPKSLHGHLSIIVDDLLGAYNKGVKCVDASMPVGSAGRTFRCHVCLLFWTGDYPAQASVKGMHSKCCLWCDVKSEHAPEISRRMWNGMRRYLRKFSRVSSRCLAAPGCFIVWLSVTERGVPVSVCTQQRTILCAVPTAAR